MPVKTLKFGQNLIKSNFMTKGIDYIFLSWFGFMISSTGRLITIIEKRDLNAFCYRQKEYYLSYTRKYFVVVCQSWVSECFIYVLPSWKKGAEHYFFVLLQSSIHFVFLGLIWELLYMRWRNLQKNLCYLTVKLHIKTFSVMHSN